MAREKPKPLFCAYREKTNEDATGTSVCFFQMRI